MLFLQCLGFRISIHLLVFFLCSGTLVSASSLSEVFKKVKQSVVVIQTVEKDVVGGLTQGPVRLEGLGSGVLLSNGGMVLTAAHVVQTADEILVGFPNGESVPARVIGSEPAADVALLELAALPENPQPAKLGDSDTVQIGDEIFIVGAPLGLSYTLTVGHISARRLPNVNTIYSTFASIEFFQTDAAINLGNSGGPMFNMAGEVIGIVSQKASKTDGHEGLGFAVTSNMAKKLLLEEKSVWSGVYGYLLGGDMAKALNLPQPTGFLIQRVGRGSLAARAGIRAGTMPATINGVSLTLGGDIVLKVMGIPVTGNNHAKIKQRMNQLKLGEGLTVTILRDGKKMVLDTQRMLSP